MARIFSYWFLASFLAILATASEHNAAVPTWHPHRGGHHHHAKSAASLQGPTRARDVPEDAAADPEDTSAEAPLPTKRDSPANTEGVSCAWSASGTGCGVRFHLDAGQLRRGTYRGDWNLITPLFEKLKSGKPVSVAAIGGSVTKAHEVRRGDSYLMRVATWLKSMFP
ncbi:hypothetical protein CYMTET_28210, partial [Cymbomonas tetramitiformis]